jgi:hypothetical protein
MNKPLGIYKSLTKAIDGFNERHDTCRKYLADLIGYRGENASIQFSNALNPNNTSKTLNHEKEEAILHALDHEGVKEYFTGRLKAYGMRPVDTCRPETTVINLHEAIDNATIESGEAHKTTKLALKDNTLSEDELRAIVKENEEAQVSHAEVADMAKKRLAEMEEK